MTGENPPPADHWDDNVAAQLPGKLILVGVTYCDADGVVTEQQQVFGTVEYAEKSRGIRLVRRKNQSVEILYLPPDTRSFREAPPGEYRLRSTGEVVINPDFTAEWTVYEPDRAR